MGQAPWFYDRPIKGLEKYGIKISKEWLLNGVGTSPFEQSSANFQFTGDGERETFLYSSRKCNFI